MTRQAPGPGVVLITGIMASGKSTVAQSLAERLPRAVHVRGDVFRRMIVSGRHEYTPGTEDPEAVAQLALRHRLSATTADAYARAGFTAIVQDVVLGAGLGAYPGLVRTRPFHVVVLAPDAETVAARESGRAKTGYGAWTVAELDRALRDETPRIGLWLDSSGLDVAGTVDAVLARWAEARVA
ncbi:AAA family ATPase [Streptomyces sp. NPDC091292]|uniref:AAA family ATPase n=1 Tax=Streptomyces sp. NPDC091292 TaxID=3365991 RepID=UPI00381AD534